MFTKRALILIIGAALSFPLTAAAQGKGVTATAAGKGGVVSAEALIARYQTLAGSESNANSLVNGVRSGAPTMITLVGPSLELPTPTLPKPCVPAPGKPCPKPLALATTTQTPPTIKVEFTSPIGNTGYGNVDIALALAAADVEKKLASPYETSPTPEQLRAALLGGEVRIAPGSATKVTFLGVLELRRKGNGWGEVAKTLDFDLK